MMHAVHKILAVSSGKDSVEPGEIVNAKIDVAGINDIYRIVVNSFEEMGGTEVWDPSKVVIFQDHNAPSSTIGGAENQRAYRKFAKDKGIENVFEVERGICHEVAVQNGFTAPGRIVVITDSHSTTHGAFGCLGTGLGSTDLAVTLMEGSLWFVVPEVIRFTLAGTLPAGVSAKDVSLFLLGRYGTDVGNYKTLEFSGPVVAAMDMEERMVLCNMAVEMGAKSAYIQPDAKTLEYLENVGVTRFTVYETDPGFAYCQDYLHDLTDLVPQVACPDRVDNVHPVSEVAGIPMDQVFIGSCTGGRLPDIAVAAKVLAGRHRAPDTRLIVTMASKEILQKALELGYLRILIDAGASVTVPGCGPCFGSHAGVLAAGETCVSTSSRNYPGRMGSPKAKIYLASPLTAAATALTGKLTDPGSLGEF
jgi:3-isopropylmalate/(R)-2-methylmalate dehydratase large subunit